MSEISYLKRVEVRVQDLEVGMYVGQLDKPWEQSSFLFQGFPIESERQIEQIKRECRKVYVDFKTREQLEHHLLQVGAELVVESGSSRAIDRKETQSQSAKSQSTKKTAFITKGAPSRVAAGGRRTTSIASDKSTSLADALPSALSAFKRANAILIELHNSALKNQTLDIEPLKQVVADLMISLKFRPEALLLLLNLKHKEQYTTEHQLRVGILAIGFGIHLGMSDEQLKSLGLSSLLYDIGKARMPSLVLNKPTKIEKQDALLLQHHPEESFRILSKIPNLSEVVKEVALSHHERFDGKGYPRHIHKDRVSRYAKIVSIIDSYDAITSDRAYGKAQTAEQAIQIIKKNSGDKFDPFLVDNFEQWLTPFPVGSLVEMESGEVGLVLKAYLEAPTLPKILIISNKIHESGNQTVVDLSHEEGQVNSKKFKIWGLIVDGTYGLRVKDFLDKDSVGVTIWNQNRKKNSPFDKFLD